MIMDVEATTAVRQAEVTAAKTMIDRAADTFEVSPSRLAADTGYASAELLGWLVDERAIEPRIPVFDKSERTDGTFPAPTLSTTRKSTSLSVLPESSCEDIVDLSLCHAAA
jgi:hypothetical protein